MLIMSDPLEMESKSRRGGSYMEVGDITLISRLVEERYRETPALLAQVIFCFANPGVGDRYGALAQKLTQAWQVAFSPTGGARCCGVKWGSFFVFVGARTRNRSGLAEPFDDLRSRLRHALTLAHSSAVSMYDEAGTVERPAAE